MKCDKCQQEKDDALRRMRRASREGRAEPHFGGDTTLPEGDPVLCAECCSQYPGREWMRHDTVAS
jgi:hypothetical protein